MESPGITLFSLRANHLGGLETAQPGECGTSAQERCIDRQRVKPSRAGDLLPCHASNLRVDAYSLLKRIITSST